MILPKKKEPTVTSPEIQEDVSRDAIAEAFQNAMVGHLRSHVPGTNINEKTFLASDYLNQFHELLMLLEALPVDPATFAADLNQWHAERTVPAHAKWKAVALVAATFTASVVLAPAGHPRFLLACLGIGVLVFVARLRTG